MIIINYTIKNDIIFSFLFSHEDILKDFLEACLKINIKEVEVTNQFSLRKMRYRDKGSVLDIKAVIDNDKVINIEMQNKEQSFYSKRILAYSGGLLRGELAKGESYENLRDVIVINIIDFTIFPKIDDIHTIWRFKEEKHPDLENLEGLELHFLELEKFRKSNPDLRDKLNQWLALVDTENKKWLEVAMDKNPKIKESIKKVDEFLSDDEIRDIIEAQEKWEMDYRSSISDAKRISLEKGLAEGHKKGLVEGHEQGLAEGREKERKEIIRKLLTINMDIKQIAKATGLTEEDILKLKK